MKKTEKESYISVDTLSRLSGMSMYDISKTLEEDRANYIEKLIKFANVLNIPEEAFKESKDNSSEKEDEAYEVTLTFRVPKYDCIIDSIAGIHFLDEKNMYYESIERALDIADNNLDIIEKAEVDGTLLFSEDGYVSEELKKHKRAEYLVPILEGMLEKSRTIKEDDRKTERIVKKYFEK